MRCFRVQDELHPAANVALFGVCLPHFWLGIIYPSVKESQMGLGVVYAVSTWSLIPRLGYPGPKDWDPKLYLSEPTLVYVSEPDYCAIHQNVTLPLSQLFQNPGISFYKLLENLATLASISLCTRFFIIGLK